MNYLFSVRPTHIQKGDEELWAPADEPVVPWFPAILKNVFLSVRSFKQSPYAIVRNRSVNLNELRDCLVKEYPGLPEELHGNYVFKTAEAAHSFPVGTKLLIVVEPQRATLRVVGDEESSYVMWERQPFGEI